MKTKFHIEITQNVLKKYFSQDAIKKIIRANIRQDRINYQFSHDFIHFDGSAFAEGFEYISGQMDSVYTAIVDGKVERAWASLGRILHSWQDFYSHSNYVDLWMKKTGFNEPNKVNPNDQDLINSPTLRSGKNYGITEFLAMIPILSILIKPLMPADSHAVMNLDSPKSGPLFKYAYCAAKLRTEVVIEEILDHLDRQHISREVLNSFLGK